MRKSFVALLLLMGAAAFLTNLALAQSGDQLGEKLLNKASVQERLTRAAKLRVSAGPDPDSVWVGHVKYPTPGNPWNVGVGHNWPMVVPVADDSIGIWDWDNYITSGPDQESDSLMGWWPIREAYTIVAGTDPDYKRPWDCLDFGNQANYIINQGLKRTFGVTGVWHRDVGKNAGAFTLAKPNWIPLQGTASAWCGLRAEGDNAVFDVNGTGNPFTSIAMQFNGATSNQANGTTKLYPGYAGQWDQMLYRDVEFVTKTPGAVTISFRYSTYMATDRNTDPTTMNGWFDKDPLSLGAGNFISANNAGVAAPIDSFMVYAGVPVDEAACKYSDGNVAPVFDVQRRWFSEVIRVNEPGFPYYHLMGQAGIQPYTAFTTTLTGTQVENLLNPQSGPGPYKIRFVFRVKTNDIVSDAGGGAPGAFSSAGAGAAIVDSVVVNGTMIGDFEAALSINPSKVIPATAAWKSTGKPPAVFFHVADVRTLSYNELCGAWDSPARGCNIYNNIISAGDIDNNEAAGGTFGTAEQERMDGMFSPAIDLTDGPGTPPGLNEMGLRKSIADVADDIYTWYDMFAGIFNLNFTGNAWQFGFQVWPAKQNVNNVDTWGEVRFPTFQFFNPEPQCFFDWEPAYTYGLIRTSSPDGLPDSLRVFMGKNQQCFRFAVSSGCSPTDGCYFDNMAVLFSDVVAGSGSGAPAISAQIWDLFNDAFPVNDNSGFPGTADFDTLTALIKTGINRYPNTGDMVRMDVPGDSSWVSIGTAGSVRVDLVFRVEPGPGNYVTIGDTSSGLRKVPTSTAKATAGDGTWFGQYMLATSSPFGKGTHPPGDRWDRNVWNSSRCDTNENNLFPIPGKGGQPTTGRYCSQRHESDINFTTLGITKNRCFLNDTNGTATNTIAGNNVNCTTVPAWAQDPAIALRAGYDGVQTTKEYTKILPDGMFTPGTHVEYFYRSGNGVSGAQIATMPDTNYISPQSGQGPNTDGQRWEHFGILPDRWKDPTFHHGGLGMACMLYVDYDNRRGTQRAWVSTADSIGATQQAKWGANNGWHAKNNQVYVATNVGLDDGICVRTHGGQPGTTWDMYAVKASESLTTQAGAFGSRLAAQGINAAAGKDSKQGPTPKMLKTYYRMVMILTGDMNSGIFGPFVNRSQDDVTLLQDWLRSGSVGNEKLLYIQGDGFAQSETQTGGILSAHKTFMTDFLGMELRNISYANESGNLNDVADLIPTNVITSNGDVYGIRNTCVWSNDVLKKVATVSEATEANFYEPVGPTPPYVSGVYKPSSASRPWITLVDGWDMRHLTGRYDVSALGRLAYMYNALTNVFGSMCAVAGTPEITLDTPLNPKGSTFVDFMNIRNNPMVSGNAKVHFGLARADRVQIKVYDVTGRLVRTLADRSYTPGEHDVFWDGSNDAGQKVARGVYFTQVKFLNSRFTDAKKLTVLK